MSINLASSFALYASRTADKMSIPKNETLARACVELMFDVMLECAKAKTKPVEQYTYAEQQTVRCAGQRYERFERYAPDFLKDISSEDRDAVLVAMLSPGYAYLADASDEGNDDPDKKIVYKHADIAPELIMRAEEMIDEAESLLNMIVGTEENADDPQEPHLGSVFLAHGYLGEFLAENGRGGYESYDAEQNKEIRENVFAPARAFVHAHTLHGQDLIEYMDLAEAYLDTAHPPEAEPPAPPEPVAKQRSFLTFVPNTP